MTKHEPSFPEPNEEARGGGARMIGPYRIESLLGEGGMGVAFKAWDERLGRYVALKQVRDEASNARRRARFRREARTAAQLTHPSVVQVYDILEDPEGDWIVMELVHGKTLAAWLSRGPLEPQRAIALGIQIAEGLAAAHDRGIVHRDLKTENVMVEPGPPERARILDFGLAKYVELDPGEPSISERGQVVGTARAMSPEQARGFEVGPRSDLFSLGTVLYEMLTGVSPFVGKTFMDTLSRVVSHTQDPASTHAPDLPPDASRLIDQLLQKAPELRPADAGRVADRLRRIGGEPDSEAREMESSETRIEAPRSTVSDSGSGQETLTVDLRGRGRDGPTGGRSSSVGAAIKRWVPLGLLAIVPVVLLFVLDSGRSRLGDARLGDARLGDVRQGDVRQGDSKVSTAESDLGSTRADRGSVPDGEPSPPSYERGAALLRDFHRPGHIDQAVEIFLKLTELDDGSASAYAGLAGAYWRKFEDTSKSRDPMFLRQAEAAAEEAVRLDPNLVDARISRGRVYTELGRFDEALADLEQAHRLAPDNPEVWYAQGDLHQLADRKEAAVESYLRAHRLAPDDRRFCDALGGVLFHLSRYDEAQVMFERSVELAPDSIYGFRNLAAVHHVKGRYAEAANMLQAALKIRPDGSLYSNLGAIFFIQGLYSRAADAYEKALDMSGASNDYRYWANLADAYRWLPERRQESQDAYLRALQLLDKEAERKPDNLAIISRRALYAAKLGDSYAARTGLEKLEGLGDPSSLDSYSLFRAAVANELLGRRSEAIELLKEAFAKGFSPSEVGADPELRALRADPAYHRMLLALERAAPD